MIENQYPSDEEVENSESDSDSTIKKKHDYFSKITNTFDKTKKDIKTSKNLKWKSNKGGAFENITGVIPGYKDYKKATKTGEDLKTKIKKNIKNTNKKINENINYDVIAVGLPSLKEENGKHFIQFYYNVMPKSKNLLNTSSAVPKQIDIEFVRNGEKIVYNGLNNIKNKRKREIAELIMGRMETYLLDEELKKIIEEKKNYNEELKNKNNDISTVLKKEDDLELTRYVEQLKKELKKNIEMLSVELYRCFKDNTHKFKTEEKEKIINTAKSTDNMLKELQEIKAKQNNENEEENNVQNNKAQDNEKEVFRNDECVFSMLKGKLDNDDIRFKLSFFIQNDDKNIYNKNINQYNKAEIIMREDDNKYTPLEVTCNKQILRPENINRDMFSKIIYYIVKNLKQNQDAILVEKNLKQNQDAIVVDSDYENRNFEIKRLLEQLYRLVNNERYNEEIIQNVIENIDNRNNKNDKQDMNNKQNKKDNQQEKKNCFEKCCCLFSCFNGNNNHLEEKNNTLTFNNKNSINNIKERRVQY